MIHFLYLIGLSLLISVALGAFSGGTNRARMIYAAKTFLQFVLVSLALAWILYFIPW